MTDVRNKAKMLRIVERAKAEFGGIDLLINNAGITRPTRFLEIPEEEYDLVVDISLKGTFLTSQSVIPSMLQRGGGAIVSMSSVSGPRGGGVFGASHYSAAKAGIMGLTKALAREFTSQGIRVNCVAPSMIDTEITGGKLSGERKVDLAASTLVGRLGSTEDVVKSILFLLSDESAYLTGVTLNINGGSHMH